MVSAERGEPRILSVVVVDIVEVDIVEVAFAISVYYDVLSGHSRQSRGRHSRAGHGGRAHTGVCEKHTPPWRRTLWKIGFQSTKSGARMRFLPLDCLAKARAEGVFFHRHRQ